MLRRAARVIVDFQGRGFPGAGHAVMNGMVAQAVDNHVGAAIVPGVFALAGGNAQQPFAAINSDCVALLLIPPTESDHLVVDGPIRKCIIAGVENQNAAAVPDIVFKSNLDFTRPGRAAADVVAGLNNHVVVAKVRTPLFPCRRRGGGWSRRNRNSEQPRSFQDAAQQCRCLMPIVVAEAIQDENSDPRLAWGCRHWLGK